MARLEDPLTDQLDDAGFGRADLARHRSNDRNQVHGRFEEAYEANFSPLLSYALRRVSAPGDAADVVAETFLVAWRRVGEMPEGAQTTPWLYAVARRVLANYHRAGVRRTRLADRLRSELNHLGPSLLEIEESPVTRALRRLSDQDREILMLTSWEGLSPSEVSDVLGVRPSVARTRLSRARKRLRRNLERPNDEAGRRND